VSDRGRRCQRPAPRLRQQERRAVTIVGPPPLCAPRADHQKSPLPSCGPSTSSRTGRARLLRRHSSLAWTLPFPGNNNGGDSAVPAKFRGCALGLRTWNARRVIEGPSLEPLAGPRCFFRRRPPVGLGHLQQDVGRTFPRDVLVPWRDAFGRPEGVAAVRSGRSSFP